MPKYSGISRQANTSQSTMYHHLEKMGKVNKLGVWVSHALSEKSKADHLSIVTSLLSQQRNNSFLDEVSTGDEKLINMKKGSGLIRINLHSRIQRLSFMAENNVVCVMGSS